MPPAISLRPAAPADLPFLRELFADSRAADFGALPAQLREQLIDLQFETQRREYASLRPDALDEIVGLAGSAVGRIWTAREVDALHILDVTVSLRYRGRGIGTAVLDEVAARADTAGLAVHLHVWAANHAARRLYERCGFVTDSDVAADNGAYAAMRRPALVALSAG
jgi:ribosomal protein S18 acetylase RimI-like enzyme